jgi:hypothetical protein
MCTVSGLKVRLSVSDFSYEFRSFNEEFSHERSG